MSESETTGPDTQAPKKSQGWLILVALALLAAAGFWTLRSRDSWRELSREWSVVTPKVEELDQQITGRQTGEIAGVTPHELKFHQAPSPLASKAVTSDWTTLLGPNKNSTSPETPLAKDWPEEGPPLVWTRVHGPTYATPAVKDDYLIDFYRYGDEEFVVCLRPETGKTVWESTYPTSYVSEYGFGGGPKCGPVIDEDRVYTYGAEGVLNCFRLDSGEVLWTKNPVEHLPQNYFGVGDAPLVEGDLLIVTVGDPEGPCVVAYNKYNGELVWEVGDQWRAGYASPIAATIHGERRVFVFAGGKTSPPKGGLLVIDPVEGKEVFRFPWRSRSYESVNASCPVVVGNEVFISSSYRMGGVLLRLNADGSYEQRWTSSELGTHFMTPVYRDGYLYGFDGELENEAELVCLEWETGKLMSREQITWTEKFMHGGQIRTPEMQPGRGSLLLVNGDFLCLGENGHLLWLDLSPEGPELLNRAWLVQSANMWGGPVVSQGLFYLNQPENSIYHDPPRLLCFDLRGRPEESEQQNTD